MKYLFMGLFLISGMVKAQLTVVGQVTDTENRPIPFANILIVGTDKGTISDGEGFYRLSVAAGQGQLQFSALGYTTNYVDIANRETINVALSDARRN